MDLKWTREDLSFRCPAFTHTLSLSPYLSPIHSYRHACMQACIHTYQHIHSFMQVCTSGCVGISIYLLIDVSHGEKAGLAARRARAASTVQVCPVQMR